MIAHVEVARRSDLVGEGFAVELARDILKSLSKRALVAVTFYGEFQNLDDARFSMSVNNAPV